MSTDRMDSNQGTARMDTSRMDDGTARMDAPKQAPKKPALFSLPASPSS